VIGSVMTPTVPAGEGAGGFEAQRADAVRTARRILDRLDRLPSVTSACVASDLPFDFIDQSTMVEPEVEAQRPALRAHRRSIGPGCFETFGTRLLSGRDFSLEESMDPPRAIVNQAFAKQLLGVEDGVGHHFRFAVPPDMRGLPPPPWVEIVGMTEDALEMDLTAGPQPAVYLPQLVIPFGLDGGNSIRMAIAVKTDGDTAPLIAALPKALAEVAPDAPVFDIDTLLAFVEHTFRGRLALERVLSAFGISAIVLAAIGLFGVTSYSVARRAPEIGIRRALGASRRDIVWMILRETGSVVLLGGCLGLLLSWLGRGFLSAFLFGVSAEDPATYAGVCLGILVVAALAAFFPARAAAAVSPSRALAGR
jgi:hypothetical protein